MLPTKSSCFFHYKQNMLPTTNACFLLTEPAGDNPIVQEQEQEPNRRKDMTEKLRQQVYQALLTRSNNGKLRRKDTSIVAAQFGVHIRSVQRLWRRGKTQLDHNIPVVVTSTKQGRSGRKAIPPNLELLRNIPLSKE